MKDKVLFVWDFHGVLETGNVKAVREICNVIFEKRKLPKRITLKQAKEWYGLSWFDYFKLAFPEGDEKIWKSMVKQTLSLREKGWSTVRKNLRLMRFAKEVLEKIKGSGHQNIILSNTNPKHVNKFTDLLDITDYFDNAIGVDNHLYSRLGRKIQDVKGEVLAAFLKGKDFNKLVLIGDRESDIAAGKQNKAVTYLFLNPEFSDNGQKTKADYVISDLREILREI